MQPPDLGVAAVGPSLRLLLSSSHPKSNRTAYLLLAELCPRNRRIRAATVGSPPWHVTATVRGPPRRIRDPRCRILPWFSLCTRVNAARYDAVAAPAATEPHRLRHFAGSRPRPWRRSPCMTVAFRSVTSMPASLRRGEPRSPRLLPPPRPAPAAHAPADHAPPT
ncbi:hypothetical protein COCNU_scaffold002253G000010 [Cocos nucifera]|nr:hypothetical protein [Cocos nucifera]